MPVVEMGDGRTVEFGENRGTVKSEVLADEGPLQIRFDFKDGSTFVTNVPECLLREAAAYGVTRRIITAARGDSPVDAARALSARIESGDFSITRNSSNSGLSPRNVLVQAFAEYAGIEISDAIEKLAPVMQDKTQVKQLQAAPALAAIIARIKAERDSGKEQKEQAGAALLSELTSTAD